MLDHIRGVDGEFHPAPAEPECACDGTGMTTVTVTTGDGRQRDIARVCRACRPDTASRVPTVAGYVVAAPVRGGRKARYGRPRLTVVR